MKFKDQFMKASLLFALSFLVYKTEQQKPHNVNFLIISIACPYISILIEFHVNGIPAYSAECVSNHFVELNEVVMYS